MKKRLCFISFIFVISIALSACSNSMFEPHSSKQLAYINDSSYTSIDKYASGASNTGDAKGYVIKYNVKTTSLIIFSENEDFSNPLYIDEITSNTNSYEAYNFMSGKTYYWNIESEGISYKSGSFIVKDTYPRIIMADGVKNIRDLGYKDVIKQGLIYRGGEFDFKNGSRMIKTISKEGINVLTNHIKIKTDIDLRDNDEVKGDTSALGNDISYIRAPMYFKGRENENVLTYKDDIYDNKAQIKKVLEILADSSNLPAYFHCAKGKDRTGVISFIIESILGQSFELIMKDYCFTNFTFEAGVDYNDIITTYYEDFNNYSGFTLKEKVINYCKNEMGISQNTIDAIINNFAA